MLSLYGDELDQSKQPKHRHMLRILANLPHTDDPQLRKDLAICAILHDAVEDEKITLDKLRELGYSDLNIRRLEALNRQPDYPPGIKKAHGDPVILEKKHQVYQEHILHMLETLPPEILIVYAPEKFLDQHDNTSTARLKNINVKHQERYNTPEELEAARADVQQQRRDKYNPLTKPIYDVCNKFFNFEDWGRAMQIYIKKKGLESPENEVKALVKKDRGTNFIKKRTGQNPTPKRQQISFVGGKLSLIESGINPGEEDNFPAM